MHESWTQSDRGIIKRPAQYFSILNRLNLKQIKFYSSVESPLSLGSCSGEPIIGDFIKIDNGLLTLQLSLNAKQRLSGKRTGDDSVHGDKGSENQKDCFPFLKYQFHI